MQLGVDVINRGLTADEALEVLLHELLQLPRALPELPLQCTHARGQLRGAALAVKDREVRLGVEAFLARQ